MYLAYSVYSGPQHYLKTTIDAHISLSWVDEQVLGNTNYDIFL